MTDIGRFVIGVLSTEYPLTLTPAPNGGWIIGQTDPVSCQPQVLGAYSNGKDALRALEFALTAEFTPHD